MSAAVSLPPILRTCGEDGAHHFTDLKWLSLSGAHYLQALNEKRDEPTRPMLISTVVHHLVLGPRADGKKLVRFPGKDRRVGGYKEFVAEHAGEEIVTATEWSEAEEIAGALLSDPLVLERLDGARTEVPLTWEENGVKFATSGIDLVRAGALGDLKGTHSAQPEKFQRHAFGMFYHVQLAHYRRGALANAIDCSNGLFVLGYEMKPPYVVVPLEMTENLIDHGDRTLNVWIERLRVLRQSIPEPRAPKDWPSYVQSATPWDVPPWLQTTTDDDEESDAL